MPHSLQDLNAASCEDFSNALGAIFEDTPEIAKRAWNAGPFSDRAELHRAMSAVVAAMSPEEQLALIRAHPDLGSRAQMADASVREQAGVGLDRLAPEDYDRFQRLNRNYREKFGFPFIVAVRGKSVADILDEFERRLAADPETERQGAIGQILQIAAFRLEDAVTETT